MENSGCKAMFAADKVDDLGRMYNLFQRAHMAIKEVQEVMKECVRTAGQEIMQDPEKMKDPVSYITALIALKHKYDHFVKFSFKDCQNFQQALKSAFEGFLNQDTRAAQYLTLFVDELFRKGIKGMREQEVDTNLEYTVTIFRFLQDKDVFENFYKLHLARRLLTNRSLSDDSEKLMISKLKGECGHLYTSKLEGMFQDIKLSEDLVKAYRAHPADAGSPIVLSVNVLTSGFWPNSTTIACNLPQELQECCNRFQSFYLQKHTGRRLSWQFQHGTADLKAVLGRSRHELNVTTLQMVILLLFNQQQQLTYNEIAAKTGIPPDELKRHLMSLYVTPKVKILVKEPAEHDRSKDPWSDDVFVVNQAFESKLHRLKVPLVALRGAAAEIPMPASSSGAADVPPTVEEDRKHLVEAVIVRIMKSRKTLEHNQLVIEVTRHLTGRFHPTPVLIKQRIEKLIEREYLERSATDRRVYNYLA